MNFEFQFVHILAGWEGSTHNIMFLANTFHKQFSIQPGGFYLANAGYGLQNQNTQSSLFELDSIL